jgi:hypothetical protein
MRPTLDVHPDVGSPKKRGRTGPVTACLVPACSNHFPGDGVAAALILIKTRAFWLRRVCRGQPRPRVRKVLDLCACAGRLAEPAVLFLCL